MLNSKLLTGLRCHVPLLRYQSINFLSSFDQYKIDGRTEKILTFALAHLGVLSMKITYYMYYTRVFH